MYGAFGVPVALLLWISFTVKLLLYCAAWTATGHVDEEEISDVENVVPDPAAASAGSPGTPLPPTGATPLR